MKALKEKRISLRSLWRMGLVVLSVFALAFAACGDSDSGDGSTPPTGQGAGSTVVPISMTFEKTPVTVGPVLEGQIVSLVGISAKVVYSDGTTKSINDPTKFVAQPSIYDYRLYANTPPAASTEFSSFTNEYGEKNNYVINYAENGAGIVQTIRADTLGPHLRLVDIVFTGSMDKQVYYIDDIPDLTGLTIEGRYSPTNTVYKNKTNGDYPEEDWFNLPLPFTTNNTQYRWAWVFNSKTNTGSYAPNDQPGVILSVGSYGAIGTVSPGQSMPGVNVSTSANGTRVPVQRIIQITGIGWAKEPTWENPIFFDDPTLISKDSFIPLTTPGVDSTRYVPSTRWTEYALSGATIALTYDDGTTSEEYSIINWGLLNAGRPGNNPTGSQLNLGGTWATSFIHLINAKGTGYYNPSLNTSDSFAIPGDAVDGVGYSSGDGGWAQWAILAQPKIRIGYRGKYFDTEVPVLNRLAEMTAVIRDGSENVQMEGYNYVYRRPETMSDFLSRVQLSVRYTRRGNDTATGTREDLAKDIADGFCWGVITNNQVTLPTLYSTNIFNFEDEYDWKAQAAISDIETGMSVTDKDDVKGNSALTLANATAFASKGKLIVANIQYRGWAGDPGNIASVRNRAVNVEVLGYSKDPE